MRKAKLFAKTKSKKLLAEVETVSKKAKLILKAEVEEAEMHVRLRLERANLEAEEKKFG